MLLFNWRNKMKPKNLLTISVCLLLLSTLLLSIILKYKLDDNKNVNSDILENINLENIKKVKIKVDGEKKAILENVYLKIDESFNLELHLDSDDGNATLLKTGDTVEVIREEE